MYLGTYSAGSCLVVLPPGCVALNNSNIFSITLRVVVNNVGASPVSALPAEVGVVMYLAKQS